MPSTRELTVSLTPMNLLLTAGLFIWGLEQYNRNFFITASMVFLLGYGVEVAGVNTGLLFGEYYYGSPLGWKLFNTPLMIGVNWFLLSFAASGIAEKLTQNAIAKVVLASALMVGLDFLIEPVAVSLDFWNWASLPAEGAAAPAKNYHIPIQNYIMWFVSALVINSVIHWRIKHLNFNLSALIFAVQITFFGLLNWLL